MILLFIILAGSLAILSFHSAYMGFVVWMCMNGEVDSYLILSVALSLTYNIIFIFIIIIIEWNNWMITTEQLMGYDKQLNQLAE